MFKNYIFNRGIYVNKQKEVLRSKKRNSENLTKFESGGWGTIVYCEAMFWVYVGMVNDGSNIIA